MRHLNIKGKLGISTSHRKLMLINLVSSLLLRGQIKTTLAKAKAVQKQLDKLVTLAKHKSLHSLRQIFQIINDKKAVEFLIKKYTPLYKERQGGYTSIVKVKNRQGDNAEMAIIYLLDIEKIKDVKNVNVGKEKSIKNINEKVTD